MNDESWLGANRKKAERLDLYLPLEYTMMKRGGRLDNIYGCDGAMARHFLRKLGAHAIKDAKGTLLSLHANRNGPARQIVIHRVNTWDSIVEVLEEVDLLSRMIPCPHKLMQEKIKEVLEQVRPEPSVINKSVMTVLGSTHFLGS